MCISVNIPFKLVAKICTYDCTLEFLACNLYPKFSRSIRLILVYRSPKGSHQSLDSLIRFIYDNVPNNVHSKFILV